MNMFSLPLDFWFFLGLLFVIGTLVMGLVTLGSMLDKLTEISKHLTQLHLLWENKMPDQKGSRSSD